jgi:hypothetical protein
MPTARKADAKRPSTIRSRITNGSKLLEGVDARSAPARRFRDLALAFETELGGNLNTAETALVKLAAATVVRSEQFQAAIINGEQIDDAELVRLTNTATRTLRELAAARAKRSSQTTYSLDDLAVELNTPGVIDDEDDDQ